MQKVSLYVSGTEWTRSCRNVDNLAAKIDADDPEFPDVDDWAIVEKPIRGIASRR